MYFVVTSVFAFQSSMFCIDNENQFDLTEQANADISLDQMMYALASLPAYKNIVQAGAKASESAAYKKSYDNFLASYKNLLQTYTKEVAVRLNSEEKEVVKDLLSNVKDVVTFIKDEARQVRDSSIDQATREQRLEDLKNKLTEQFQQLTFKSMPLGLAIKDYLDVQEQKANPEEVEKKLNENFTQRNFVP